MIARFDRLEQVVREQADRARHEIESQGRRAS